MRNNLKNRHSEFNHLMTLFNNEKYLDLINYAKNLEVKYPNSSHLFNICGIANLKINSHKNAKNNFTKAILINPKNYDAINNLALLLESEGLL